MFKLRHLAVLSIAFASITNTGTTNASSLPPVSHESEFNVAEKLIVTLEPGFTPSAILAVLKANGGTIDKVLNERVMRVRVSPETLVNLTVELSADPRVTSVAYYRTNQ